MSLVSMTQGGTNSPRYFREIRGEHTPWLCVSVANDAFRL